MQTPRSHQAFYKTGPYAQYLVAAHSTGSAPIDMFAADQPAGHFPDPAFPNLLLYLATRGCTEARFDWGAGRWRGRWRANDLTLVPPDAASDVEMSDRHRFLAFCLPPAAVTLVQGPDRAVFLRRIEPLFSRPFRDPLTYQLALELWRVGQSGRIESGWYADHLAIGLLGRLDSLAGSSAFEPPATRRDLQLIAFIDANLGSKLSLRRLSDEWRVPGRQLQAIARAVSGLSLYQLVLERRLLAAEAMLMRPGADLAEVALTCGFSSQAHFTALFARRFGVTPGAARRKAMTVSLIDPATGDGS